MSNFTRKEFFVVALMLFAMFFGAGNFILPPMLGKEAGENFYVAILFFCATGVVLPVLGVAAVARAGTLKDLSSRVSPIFALIFVAAIYISIGPALAIPRASNMPYEIMIAPYVEGIDLKLGVIDLKLFIYSCIYFALNYYVCINPSKVLNTLGRYLTPILLTLIAVFFITALCVTDVNIASASERYTKHAVATAFVEGYQTMDALAALVFGISVVAALKTYGINDEKKLSVITVKTGLFAGIILMIVYILLGYLGYIYGNTFSADNGAVLLSSISNDLFGHFGRIILGFTAFLACITTTIGLINSTSTYFSSVTKVPYKTWVVLWVVISLIIANYGLTQILKFSVPVLIAIYPIAIVLIILSLINSLIDSSKIVYCATVYTAALIGILNALDLSGFSINGTKILDLLGISPILLKLPFYDAMLGWVVPVIVMFAVSYIIYSVKKKDNY